MRCARSRDNMAAAHGLNDAVELAAKRLGANPHLGRGRPYLPARFRAWPLRRYGYLLFYDCATDPVRIVRILHMARDLPQALAELRDLPDPPEPS